MRDMQACINELNEASESERGTVTCAARWNEVRSTLDEPSPASPDEIVEVHRIVYPYNHKRKGGSSIRRDTS